MKIVLTCCGWKGAYNPLSCDYVQLLFLTGALFSGTCVKVSVPSFMIDSRSCAESCRRMNHLIELLTYFPQCYKENKSVVRSKLRWTQPGKSGR